jgi:ribonuclease T2
MRHNCISTRFFLCSALMLVGAFYAQTCIAQSNSFSQNTGGNFDFYVLSLSWSPAFCALDRRANHEEQCTTERFQGFVTHGLWPQYEQGYPSNCAVGQSRNLPFVVMRTAKDLFPSEGLARHQWRKHGTCSGKTPSEYFSDVRHARDFVKIPARFQASPGTQETSPQAIKQAFHEENPALRADMMSVVCQKDMLREVRICLNKQLTQFVSCPEIDRHQCRVRRLQVPHFMRIIP